MILTLTFDVADYTLLTGHELAPALQSLTKQGIATGAVDHSDFCLLTPDFSPGASWATQPSCSRSRGRSPAVSRASSLGREPRPSPATARLRRRSCSSAR